MLCPRVIIFLVLCQIVSSSRRRLLPVRDQELEQHYQRTRQFSCQIPQPRAVRLHEIIPASQINGKTFFPEMTVLHRCDDAAGCCDSGSRCSPAHAESVRLPFRVTKLEDPDYQQVFSWITELHDAENHTRCACTEVVSVEQSSTTLSTSSSVLVEATTPDS